MATKRKTGDEEQLDLIDVAPKNATAIKRAARAYLKAKSERLAWLEKEQGQQEKIRDLVEEAKLQPLADGVIRFRLDGLTIKVTPREDGVLVKEVGEAAESGEES